MSLRGLWAFCLDFLGSSTEEEGNLNTIDRRLLKKKQETEKGSGPKVLNGLFLKILCQFHMMPFSF